MPSELEYLLRVVNRIAMPRRRRRSAALPKSRNSPVTSLRTPTAFVYATVALYKRGKLLATGLKLLCKS